MVKALTGALDYVIKSISPPSNDTPDFFELLPVFGKSVEKLLIDEFSKMTFMNPALTKDVIK